MNALLLVTVKEISPKLQGLTIIIDLGSSSVKAGFAQENGMALYVYIFIFIFSVTVLFLATYSCKLRINLALK